MPSLGAEKTIRDRLIILSLGIVGAACLASFSPALGLPAVVRVVVFFVALSIAFIRGVDALYIVVFAMLFSPEVPFGLFTRARAGEGSTGVVVRLEDVLMVAVVLGWMLRSAYRGRHFGIRHTPVNTAIWVYMAASVTATLLAVVGGTVRLEIALFHNLKYFEYFALFFMILAHVRDRMVIRRMLSAALIVFALALAYGYTRIGPDERVSAPFDTEPNTFGGYIVLLMCLAAGIALYDNRVKMRIAMVVLLAFALTPLLFTLSRTSYLSLLAAFVAFTAVSRHRVVIGAVFIGLIAVMAMGLPLLPERVQERVIGTFEEEREYHVQVAGVSLDASASARVISYQKAVEVWLRSPLLGHGVTGTHFIDGQFFRILAETGVIGISAFLVIFWRLLIEVWRIFRTCEEPFFRGAAMGFFCGIIAMLVHCIGANSFVIVRIAEPFWLLAGLILIVPRAQTAATPVESP